MRKFYEKQTKAALPKDFEVHHIDSDRKNNDIDNLIALPRATHRGLHHNHPIMGLEKENLIPTGVNGGHNTYLYFYLDQLDDYMPFLKQVNKWIDFRDCLLGRMWNIHNIGYDIFK